MTEAGSGLRRWFLPVALALIAALAVIGAGIWPTRADANAIIDRTLVGFNESDCDSLGFVGSTAEWRCLSRDGVIAVDAKGIGLFTLSAGDSIGERTPCLGSSDLSGWRSLKDGQWSGWVLIPFPIYVSWGTEPRTGWDVIERLEWQPSRASTLVKVGGSPQTLSHIARSTDPNRAITNIQVFISSQAWSMADPASLALGCSNGDG